MSEEFDHVTEETYSSFWPLLILIVGFLIWQGILDYSLNNQRMFYATQYQKAQPAIADAQNVADRYVHLTKDLLAAAQKDPQAAQIVKDAIQAGLYHVNPATNATNSGSATPPTDSSAPAAPADSSK